MNEVSKLIDRTIIEVVLDSTVTSIGNYAFYGCSKLASINIPNSVTFIGNYAFKGCSKLTSVTIGSGVTTIGRFAFNGCYSLKSVTIGNGVTSIGNYAFQGCVSLTSIIVNATTPPTLDNVNAFYNTNNCPIYVPASSLESYKTASNWSTYADRIHAIPS